MGLVLLSDFSIMNDTVYSDHRPVTFDMKVNIENDYVSSPPSYMRMQWDNDKTPDFISALNHESCVAKFDEMVAFLDSSEANENSVYTAVDMCVEAIRSAADPLFP